MALVKMDIHTVVVGQGPITSLVVLRSQPQDGAKPIQLPIRIGNVEATSISMGIGETPRSRPVTHDLFAHTIAQLGATLAGIAIVSVSGTTFFAQLMLVTGTGTQIDVDCRPSDAIALAVRMHAPIFVEERVLAAATLPDFKGVEQDSKKAEMERFHNFIETLSPDDFSM